MTTKKGYSGNHRIGFPSSSTSFDLNITTDFCVFDMKLINVEVCYGRYI